MITLTDTNGFKFDVTVKYAAGGPPEVDFQPRDSRNFDCRGARPAAGFMERSHGFRIAGNWPDSPVCDFEQDQCDLLQRAIYDKTRTEGRFEMVWMDSHGLPF